MLVYFSYDTLHISTMTVVKSHVIEKPHENSEDIMNAGMSAINAAQTVTNRNGTTKHIEMNAKKSIMIKAMIYSPLLCFVLYIYLLKQYNKSTVFLMVFKKKVKSLHLFTFLLNKHKKTDEQHIRNIGL